MKLPCAQGRLNEFMTVPFSAKAHHCNKVNIFQPSGSSVLRCFVIYLGYNPRKGAKTSCKLHNKRFSCTIPVRGRKHARITVVIKSTSTIPVRGRKPFNHKSRVQSCSTLPVRGRKHRLFVSHIAYLRTIPVRGRKPADGELDIALVRTIPARGR